MARDFIFRMFALNMRPITIEISSVTLPTREGFITILPGHTPLITVIEMGIVTVQSKEGDRIYYAVMGGICKITPNRVVIYTNAYEEGKSLPKDESMFREWTKEIAYKKETEEEKIRFYLINTIKKWEKTYKIGQL